MRTLAISSVLASCFVAAFVAACTPKNGAGTPGTTPAPAGSGYGQPGYPAQPGYPQAGAPAGYPQAGAPAGYPQAGAPQGYPAPGAAPGMPGAAASAAPLATPGAFALPCQSDSACGMAHCNTQYGKCAFPCQTANDCISGAQCNTMTGFCLPGGTAH